MQNNDNIEDHIKAEEKIIDEYVNTHPYPEYGDMLQKIEKHIELYAEYGELNHNWCKIIYENPNNTDLIIESGKKIYNRGGLQALVMNHAIIKYFSPYWQSNNPAIQSQGAMVEIYFQKVCHEWKA
jgi:hypothetical protein